ncbi:uncharacterized protein [Taeniopygia guttata]|uniref:uncharacterized protein n=1 Tax=Taeniopygia guttata TaxID=59729 RepID=UPI003BB84B88
MHQVFGQLGGARGEARCALARPRGCPAGPWRPPAAPGAARGPRAAPAARDRGQHRPPDTAGGTDRRTPRAAPPAPLEPRGARARCGGTTHRHLRRRAAPSARSPPVPRGGPTPVPVPAPRRERHACPSDTAPRDAGLGLRAAFRSAAASRRLLTKSALMRRGTVENQGWKAPLEIIQAGSPRGGDTGTCPGGFGMSPERETPQSPWAAVPVLCQPSR